MQHLRLAEYFPPRTFIRTLLVRAVTLWTAVRLTIAFLLFLLDLPPLALSPRSALLLVGTVVFLAWVDMRRKNEEVVLLNLGVGRSTVVVLTAAPPLASEILLGILLRL